MRRSLPRISLLILLGSLLGCEPYQPTGPGYCEDVLWSRTIEAGGYEGIDLLFVIDSSRTMEQEQERLIRDLVPLARDLGEGIRRDPDTGEIRRYFDPFRSLHVGVISTDMGTGGYPVATCAEPEFGEDGRLLDRGGASSTGCPAGSPLFLRFDQERGDDGEEFASSLTCLADLGTDGCGFEQPLEAMLKALSPASASYPGVAPGYLPPTFLGGSGGHADGANRISETEPFLRENSYLAVILLSDEEDCSAADPALFDLDGGPYAGTPDSLRCSAHAEEALYPVSRYVEGLLQLRPDPRQIYFGAIVGVPADLLRDPEWLDYEEILADPRMQEMPEVGTDLLTPSCRYEGGDAYPPRRIVELARDLSAAGASTTLTPLCGSSYAGALQSLIERFSGFWADCLPLPFVLNEEGLLECRIEELLPEGLRCADLPGREPALGSDGHPILEGGRELCLVQQLHRERVRAHLEDGGEDPGVGWFFNDFSAFPERTCAPSVPHAEGFRLFHRLGTEERAHCCRSAFDCTTGYCDDF